MPIDLRELPIEERIRIVEEIWDSIAAESESLPLTDRQRAQLDDRIDAFEKDGIRGRRAEDVIADLRRRL